MTDTTPHQQPDDPGAGTDSTTDTTTHDPTTSDGATTDTTSTEGTTADSTLRSDSLVRSGVAMLIGPALLLVVLGLLVSVAGPAAAQDAVEQPALVLDIEDDGSADLTLVMTYDLTTDAERQAFADLQGNETMVAAIEDRFADRLSNVAAAASGTTDREMTVTDTAASLDTSADGETGIVRLTASFEQFAAVEDDRIVVDEPFASGFYTDRPVVVRYPDGYSIYSVDPAPDDYAENERTWAAGADLSGFELVLTREDGGTGGSDDGTGVPTPGFGIAVAALGVLGTALVVLRRRS